MAVEVDEDSGSAAKFAAQVVVGTFLFAVVFGAAFGLSWLAGQMQAAGAPEWMIKGAHWAEKAVFGLDLFLFGLFLISEALKFVRALLRDWRR
jgi:hypothetical protein